MFHLGGVGQGARRPKHSRNSRPFYRGTQLKATIVSPNSNNDWDFPETPIHFKSQFQTKMGEFYCSLAKLTSETFNTHSPRPSIGEFIESIGRDCKIVVCQGNFQFANQTFCFGCFARTRPETKMAGTMHNCVVMLIAILHRYGLLILKIIKLLLFLVLEIKSAVIS